ncbi:MAG: hypothetical protein QXF15_02485, partial [Candidatus Aenigmatarchaeota archaeon]
MIEINEKINSIAISAHSGYGKTYLSMALLRQFIKVGYKINILSYTKESESSYWKQFENNKQVNIDFINIPTVFEMMSFIIRHIKEQSILYINDADLYLNSPEYNEDASSLILSILSAIRKTNSKIIFEFKSIKGLKFLNIFEQLDLILVGYFTRQMPILTTINPEIDEYLRNIDTKEHDFVYIYDKDIIGMCYVNKDGIIVRKKSPQEITEEYYEVSDKALELIDNINKICNDNIYQDFKNMQGKLNEIFYTNIMNIFNLYIKSKEEKFENPLLYNIKFNEFSKKIKEYIDKNKDILSKNIKKYYDKVENFKVNETKYNEYMNELKNLSNKYFELEKIIKETNSKAY